MIGYGSTVFNVNEIEEPNPEDLMNLAEQEEDRIPLARYYEVIRRLRDEKHFSFAALAEWLNDNGVSTNYSAVYRAYVRAVNMPGDVEAEWAMNPDEYDESPDDPIVPSAGKSTSNLPSAILSETITVNGKPAKQTRVKK